MSDKTIYLIRHCQAEQNATGNLETHDPDLTALGREQAKQIYEKTHANIQPHVELIVSSPIKRCLQTALDGLSDAVARLGRDTIIVNPDAQECGPYLCNVGRPAEELAAIPEFHGINFDELAKVPDWTSKKGYWSPEMKDMQVRARNLRRWLRERPEKNIVVVSHGSFIGIIVHNRYPDKQTELFSNGQMGAFTFKSDDDDEAWLVELKTVEKVADLEPAARSAM